jgi:hypothetical protein
MTNNRSAKIISSLVVTAMALTPTLASAAGFRDNNLNEHRDEARHQDDAGDRSVRAQSFGNGNNNGYRYDTRQPVSNNDFRRDNDRRDNNHRDFDRRAYRNGNNWSNNGFGNSWNNNYSGSQWRQPAWNNSRYGYNRNNSWFSSGWNNNYNSRWNNSFSYGSGYGYNGYDYGYRRNSKTDTVILGVGLGILGLAVASAASGKSRDTRDWTDDRREYVTNGREAPRGFPEPAYDSSLPTAYDSTCLQTREYQTTITVGGQREKAYGTACLQPDGSWRQGPPQLEPR